MPGGYHHPHAWGHQASPYYTVGILGAGRRGSYELPVENLFSNATRFPCAHDRACSICAICLIARLVSGRPVLVLIEDCHYSRIPLRHAPTPSQRTLGLFGLLTSRTLPN